jgi:hypothetical protein
LGWRRQLEVEAKTGRVPAHFGIVMAQSFTATNDFIAYYYMRNVANFHLFVLKKIGELANGLYFLHESWCR